MGKVINTIIYIGMGNAALLTLGAVAYNRTTGGNVPDMVGYFILGFILMAIAGTAVKIHRLPSRKED